MTSCTTSQSKEKNETQKSEVFFPSFPDPVLSDGSSVVVYNPSNDTVTLPFWYWQQIALYVLQTESAIKVINEQ